MKSPFKFYLEEDQLVREVVAGSGVGEKSVFRNMAEICNYISEIDGYLWEARGVIGDQEKRTKNIISAAKKIIEDA